LMTADDSLLCRGRRRGLGRAADGLHCRGRGRRLGADGLHCRGRGLGRAADDGGSGCHVVHGRVMQAGLPCVALGGDCKGEGEGVMGRGDMLGLLQQIWNTPGGLGSSLKSLFFSTPLQDGRSGV
jgi:hypothetical protein